MPKLGSKERTAAFDVDAQKCFTPLCPQELPVPEGHLIVEELNRQAACAGHRIGSKDAHPSSAVWIADAERPVLSPVAGDNVDVRWPVHAVPGTRGFELLDGLPETTGYDFFVWKGIEPDMHPYGACYHDLAEQRSTGVIEYLRQQGVDTVLVGGLALDYCVRTTVLQLLRAGFRVIVNRSASRGLAPHSSESACREMTAAGAEFIDSVSDFDGIDD